MKVDERFDAIAYDCPFCDKVHNIQVLKRMSKLLVKDKAVNYEQIYYYCPQEDEEFVPGALMDENLLRAKDSYRNERELLASSEIKEIRKKYNLTQKELSNILGWGDITIQRYEKKSIQDETYDKILRMFAESPSFALESLDKHKDQFNKTRYIELREAFKTKIKEEGNQALKLQEIKNLYIDFEEPSDSNGFKRIDLDKLSKVMSFYSNYVIPLYKVKLMKLLWYTDAIYFKRYGTSMTGLVYHHLPMGAVPLAYNEILSLPAIRIEEEYINDCTAYRLHSNQSITIESFSHKELSILQEILNYFKNKKTDAVVQYMHEESAYLVTKPGQVIPYSLAKEVRNLA